MYLEGWYLCFPHFVAYYRGWIPVWCDWLGNILVYADWHMNASAASFEDDLYIEHMTPLHAYQTHTSIHPSTLAHILFIPILFHKRESSIRFSRLCAPRHHNKKRKNCVCKNKIWDFKYMLGVNRGLKNERFSVLWIWRKRE